MNKILIMGLFMLIPSLLLAQDDDNTITKNKKVTVIHGHSTADGTSSVSEKLLEECIVSLPGYQDLQAIVTSESKYLKEINGDANNNEFVKVYTASVEVNYMVHQKVLVIVTQNSVEGQEPVMKAIDKNFKQSQVFKSSATEGDMYAGKSRRQYYFSTAEGAMNDAKNRAKIWLQQQSAVVCK